MPKWVSQLVKQEETVGNKTIPGVVAWVPANDAAKAHRNVEKAMQLGVYVPKDPNERENMAKHLKAQETEAMIKRGLVRRGQAA